MSGFGSSPFGGGPYGIGTPAVSYTSGGKALPIADYRNPKAGAQRARWINPLTKRFEVDTNGQIVGMDAVQQQVYLALRTIRGTALPDSLGSDILSTQDVGDDFAARMRVAVDRALTRLIAAKLISVVSVDVSQFAEDGRFIRVRWLNLATKQERTTTF